MQHNVIRNILSKIECEDIAREFDNLYLIDRYERGVEGDCQGVSNLRYVSMIQDSLTPMISKEFNKNLITTYNYTRKYKKYSMLMSHKDREACEYSLTLHIKSSDSTIPWPIYFYIDDKKEKSILNQGDCCLYKGIELSHGRDACPVDWYIQVFMHWVDSEGSYKEHAYDKLVRGLKRKENDNT